MPPVKPMLAKPVQEIPAGQLYEPKWDGFRSVIFRDGDEVVIGSRNEKPMTRYFPEVVDAVLAELPERAVIDGEIVLVDPDSQALDFETLQLRLHPAVSRVTRLAAETPASFVAFDLIALGDDDLSGRPFTDRRAHLERVLADAAPLVHLTPITPDQNLATVWFRELEGAGLDGVIAKRPDQRYEQDKRLMAKVKHVRTGSPPSASSARSRCRLARLSSASSLLSSRRSTTTPGHGRVVRRSPAVMRPMPAAGTPARTSRSRRSSQCGCSRLAMTTWRAPASDTPPSSCDGVPTVTRHRAPSSRSNVP